MAARGGSRTLSVDGVERPGQRPRKSQQPTQHPPRRPATDAEAKALASSLRIRILRMCLDEPLTNAQIATRLGRDPASVLHHVRTLTATGFLEAMSPQKGPRGARTVPYRATRKSWTLENHGATKPMIEAFLESAAGLADHDLVGVPCGPPGPGSGLIPY